MDLDRAGKPFVEHPKGSLALALVLLGIGTAFACGWFPDSPHRRSLPGHQWIMAVLSWLVAFFFLGCAVHGFRQGPKDSSR
jgi:hypothetical protein